MFYIVQILYHDSYNMQKVIYVITKANATYLEMNVIF